LQGGVTVGRIYKRWGGVVRELFTDADIFGINCKFVVTEFHLATTAVSSYAIVESSIVMNLTDKIIRDQNLSGLKLTRSKLTVCTLRCCATKSYRQFIFVI